MLTPCKNGSHWLTLRHLRDSANSWQLNGGSPNKSPKIENNFLCKQDMLIDSLYFPSDRYDANEAVLFVAKRQQEAQNTRSRDIHDLDCHPGVWDNGDLSLHWHHPGYLCTVGKLRQFCCDEDGAVLHAFRWIHSAAVADDFLLCSHRLHATYQGDIIVIIQ